MDECDKPNSSQNNEQRDPASPTTSPPPIVIPSSSTKLSQAELLWNQFIKKITEQQQAGARKYPNPDVPEFYPRNMKIVCTEVSHETGDCVNDTRPTTCTTINTMQHNLNILNKNELLLTRMSQHLTTQSSSHPFIETPEVHAFSHYYWAFHDPGLVGFVRPLEHLPQTLNLSTDPNRKTAQLALPVGKESTAAKLATARSLHDLQLELNTKNQQLSHMNNVVKALLEEIYKINELLMRNKIKEQSVVDIHSSIEQYLKSASQPDYNCDDCCARLTEFIGHVSKQLERKIVKQHGQYRSSFVDCILSVIENSLQTLTHCTQNDEVMKKKLRKQDAYTQTNFFESQCSRAENERSKQQMTRVYRNRNFYKFDANWYPNAGTIVTRGNRIRRTNSRSYRQRIAPSATTLPSSSSDTESCKNPVQLIHQRFKNLNCRLEGIPDKKLVKFSYIVNGEEYSAIASTKKEAQYHCAWHVLNSCKG